MGVYMSVGEFVCVCVCDSSVSVEIYTPIRVMYRPAKVGNGSIHS